MQHVGITTARKLCLELQKMMHTKVLNSPVFIMCNSPLFFLFKNILEVSNNVRAKMCEFVGFRL